MADKAKVVLTDYVWESLDVEQKTLEGVAELVEKLLRLRLGGGGPVVDPRPDQWLQALRRQLGPVVPGLSAAGRSARSTRSSRRSSCPPPGSTAPSAATPRVE